MKKEERCVFCSQLHFFKIGKKKERAKKNLKEKKKPPHLAKPTIIKNSTPNQQKFPFKNTCIFPLIPVYPFEIQAGALILPPNKGSMGKGEQLLSAANSREQLQTWKAKWVVMGFTLKLQQGSLDKRGEIKRNGSLSQSLSFLFGGS